jgi:general stress protein YciG
MANAPEEKIPGESRRGFASMDPKRQREIAVMGGASVPSDKRSFSQDRSLAAKAGRKGGLARHKKSGSALLGGSVLDTHRSELPNEF